MQKDGVSVFAQRLKQLRIEKNLLQKDLAHMLDISTSAYGFYEQGKRQPDLDTLCKLANFFDVTIDYLLGRSAIYSAPTEIADISDDETQLLVRYRKMHEKQKDTLQKVAEIIVPDEENNVTAAGK